MMYVLRKKLEAMLETRKKKSNQEGFTLLELLVVVAILAAIAGTATIALKDTDARASAAAHVAMMDELNKGIQTYRVLQRNTLPNRFDSLMVSATDIQAGAGAVGVISAAGFDPANDVATGTISADEMEILVAAGITELRYINEAGTPPDYIAGQEDCTNANLQALIASRRNAVVAGNIFMSPEANGCGYSVNLDDAAVIAAPPAVVYWNGGTERLTGQENPAGAGSAYNAENNYAYLVTGIGPSSTLFDANTLGGMTTVPVYRHVKPNEYNRFMAVWKVGTYSATGTVVAADQIDLVAIVDGALDTKEEELGEWDGTRNTI